MRTQQTLFRFTAAAAIGGLVMGPGMAPIAHAQSDTAAAQVDPPSRVGRVAALLGTVSFHTADETEWQVATANYPVTSGNDFWTEPSSAAEIEVDATHVALDQDTEFDVDTLDDHNFASTTPQGAVYLRLRNFLPGDSNSVTTPRGTVTVTAAGRYEIVAGDSEQPTRLTVLDGAADFAIGNLTLHVAAHQTASVSGSDADNFQGSVGAEVDDPFLTAQLAKEKPLPPRRVAVGTVAYQPPPVVANMTGYDSIRDTGDWVQTPQYGHVWYPPVQRDWVPYRHGHWAFVAPWGWTWVDEAPWGFAPFHYGRWVQVQSRWGWIPTEPGVPVQPEYVRPVYAPALVSFVNVAGAAAVGAAVGVAAGLALGASVGWIPLGPREPYVPPFRASPTYVRNVNVTQIRNVTNITNVTNVTNNTTTINNFVNRGGATVVPAAAMTGSQPVAAAVQRVTPQQLAAVARPVAHAQAPVAPTLATVGVTPVVARQFNIAPVANAPAAPPRPVAPGPVVPPRPTAAALPAPGAPAVAPRPALAPAAPVAPKPAVPGAPAVAAAPKPPGAPTPAAAVPPVAAKPGVPPAATPAPVAAAAPAAMAPRVLPALPPARPATAPGSRPAALMPVQPRAAAVAPGASTPAPAAPAVAAPAKPMVPATPPTPQPNAAAAPAPAKPVAPAAPAAPQPHPVAAPQTHAAPAVAPAKPMAAPPAAAAAPAPVPHVMPAPAAPAPHPVAPAPRAVAPAPHPAAPAPHVMPAHPPEPPAAKRACPNGAAAC